MKRDPKSRAWSSPTRPVARLTNIMLEESMSSCRSTVDRLWATVLSMAGLVKKAPILLTNGAQAVV